MQLNQEQSTLAIIVKKNADNGEYRNERILLIKQETKITCWQVSLHTGNIKWSQLSGEIPKMTLSVSNIQLIKRQGKYLHIKFNKKYLIYNVKITGLVKKQMDQYNNKNSLTGGNIQWIFKCSNVADAQMFVQQVRNWKNYLKAKPDIPNVINGSREEKYLTSNIEKITNQNVKLLQDNKSNKSSAALNKSPKSPEISKHSCEINTNREKAISRHTHSNCFPQQITTNNNFKKINGDGKLKSYKAEEQIKKQKQKKQEQEKIYKQDKINNKLEEVYRKGSNSPKIVRVESPKKSSAQNSTENKQKEEKKQKQKDGNKLIQQKQSTITHLPQQLPQIFEESQQNTNEQLQLTQEQVQKKELQCPKFFQKQIQINENKQEKNQQFQNNIKCDYHNGEIFQSQLNSLKIENNQNSNSNQIQEQTQQNISEQQIINNSKDINGANNEKRQENQLFKYSEQETQNKNEVKQKQKNKQQQQRSKTQQKEDKKQNESQAANNKQIQKKSIIIQECQKIKINQILNSKHLIQIPLLEVSKTENFSTSNANTNIDIDSNDDIISFSNLQTTINVNNELQNGPSTPRFWDQLDDNTNNNNTYQKHLQNKSQLNKISEQVKINQFQETKKYINKQKQDRQESHDKFQLQKNVKIQAEQYTKQLLIQPNIQQLVSTSINSTKATNKAKRILRKIIRNRKPKQKPSSQSQILPTPIAKQLLIIKNSNKIKKQAITIIKNESNKRNNLIGNHCKNIINCQNIMLGMRVRLAGYCLYLFDDLGRYEAIWEYYTQLSIALEQLKLTNKIQCVKITSVKYKQHCGILLQDITQNVQKCQFVDLTQVLKRVVVEQYIQEIKKQSKMFYDIKLNKFLIWCNPDYINHQLLINKYQVQRNKNIKQTIQEIQNKVKDTWKQLKIVLLQKKYTCVKQYMNKLKQYADQYNLQIMRNQSNNVIQVVYFCSVKQSNFSINSSIINKRHSNISSNLKNQEPGSAADAVYWYGLKLLAQGDLGQVSLRDYLNAFITIAELYFYEQRYVEVTDICKYTLQTVFGRPLTKRITQCISMITMTDILENINYFSCFNQEICMSLTLLLACKIKDDKNSINQIHKFFKSVMKIMQHLSTIFECSHQNNLRYCQMIMHSIYCNYLQQHELHLRQQILKQVLEIRKISCNYGLDIIRNSVNGKYHFNRQMLHGEFSIQCIVSYVNWIMHVGQYQHARNILKQVIYGNVKVCQKMIAQLKCRYDICLVHCNSPSSINLNYLNFISYIEYYGSIISSSSSRNMSQIFLLQTIINTYCQFYAFNDYQLCILLMDTLNKFKITLEIKQEVLRQGLKKLEPALRKRIIQKCNI